MEVHVRPMPRTLDWTRIRLPVHLHSTYMYGADSDSCICARGAVVYLRIFSHR